jgi:hypothetical protein
MKTKKICSATLSALYFSASIAIPTVLFIQTASADPSGNTTPFQLNITNNSGKSLYFTVGALPDQTHTQVSNPMLCPVFAASTEPATLHWNLNSDIYPEHIQSPNIQIQLYTAVGQPVTPPGSQSTLCPVPVGKLPKSGEAVPTGGALIKCTNPEGYINPTYGTLTLNSYGYPTAESLTLNPDGKGGLTCTLNTWTYNNKPLPYRELNVGQNYLPPGGGNSAYTAGPLPTQTDALVSLTPYMNNFNGPLQQVLQYTVDSHSETQNLISTPQYDANGAPIAGTFNNQVLLQLNKGQLFIQHNLSPTEYQALIQQFGCGKSSTGFCTPYQVTDAQGNTKIIPNKFILWPNISTTVTTGPGLTPSDPLQTTTISQPIPIVISNAVRAKTVNEFVNQRMLQLILNKAQGAAPSIKDNSTQQLEGTWLAHNSTTLPNLRSLQPDGADPVTPDIKDYLNVSATTADALSLDLSQYFIPPHGTSNTLSYSLDSSYLQIDPASAENYGVSIPQSTAPIILINGVGQTTPISATSSTAAGPFTLSGHTLSLTPQQTLSPGVYQINIRADQKDASTGVTESAFTTFYIYISQPSDKGTTFANWQAGAEPSFSVLHYKPSNGGTNQKFGTAYFYTSHDFTKDFDRPAWEKTMTTLLGDLHTANTSYSANIHTAFIDVNNLGFNNPNGGDYWPLSTDPTSSTYLNGNVESSITAANMQTNLGAPDLTTGQPVYLLSNLITYLKGAVTGNNLDVALTVYPSNNLKADFTGFNHQQLEIFADMSAIPALAGGSAVGGISVDLEGGLNSVNDTQFYKLLSDKLAYQGKWFSFFYFPTVASPNFIESLGPLGALEVSTYDVGTYRAPQDSAIIPGTIPLTQQGWNANQASQIYSAYALDPRCDSISGGAGGPMTSHSWCNNSPNESYSESYRIWSTNVSANGLPYGTPAQNMSLFNGKFHLILPVSWSATQFENLYLFNPALTQPVGTEGLFMQKGTALNQWDPSCSSAKIDAADHNLQTCLLGNISVDSLAVQQLNTDPSINSNLVIISGVPGTAKVPNTKTWSSVARVQQSDYLNTNFSLYQDVTSDQQLDLNKINLAGVGAYALEMFENVPSSVAANAQNIPGSSQNAAMQTPWYVGFNPDTIVGTTLKPGYDASKIGAIWTTFGNLANIANQSN